MKTSLVLEKAAQILLESPRNDINLDCLLSCCQDPYLEGKIKHSVFSAVHLAANPHRENDYKVATQIGFSYLKADLKNSIMFELDRVRSGRKNTLLFIASSENLAQCKQYRYVYEHTSRYKDYLYRETMFQLGIGHSISQSKDPIVVLKKTACWLKNLNA